MKLIISAYNLKALRHKSETFDYCPLYHFQFKLYLSKMSSELAACNSFLLRNAPMSHGRIHIFFCEIPLSN